MTISKEASRRAVGSLSKGVKAEVEGVAKATRWMTTIRHYRLFVS